MKDLTLVIPAYNEEAALGSFLPEVIEYCQTNGCQLVIVNDGSKDNTKEILRGYETYPFFRSIHHKINRGYGGAIKTGILATRTPLVITLDADGQHQLSDVTVLYEVIRKKDADMVVGGRRKYKEGLYRKTGKKLIRFFANRLMPVNIQDLNSGMKIYRTDLLLNYMQLCPDTMALSDIITLIFINQRHLVLEHPITIVPRRAGESTINLRTAVDTSLEILHIVTLFNPMRIFFPPAIFSFIFSAVWGIPILLRGEGVSVGTELLFLTGLIFFFLGLIAEQLALIRKSLGLSVRREPPAES